jgi:site-specific DNA-adenine methylase
MTYGVPYQGSKNRIAKDIIEQLPTGSRFVDLFSGGCAITHAALLSGKWDEILANDLCPLRGQDLFRLACQGEYNKEDYYRIPTKQEFYEKRDVEPHMISVWGWNNCTRYLGQNWYDQMIEHGLTDIHEVPKGLYDPLPRLLRLQRLTGLDLSKVEFTQSDYRQYEHRDGDVVYCDVPYKGTDPRYQTKFDLDAFWEWARTCDYPVYVSEYKAPEDFACIWQKHRLGIQAVKGKNRVSKPLEKLFVHNKWR